MLFSDFPNLFLLFGMASAGAALGGIGQALRAKRRVNLWRHALMEQQQSIDRIIAEAEAARREASAARVRAEAASAAKSDFLANTSHEIRTPMSAILGMTRLLLDSPLSDEQQSWAEIVRDSGTNLLAIIDDILDLSKIEAGHLALTISPFDLYRTMADATDLLIHKTEQKNLPLIVDIGAGVPRHVMGDALRLKQIVLNLLSNAVKFTSAGYVKLVLRAVPQAEGGDHILFSAADTGLGIPPDKLDHIFGKFAQAEESTTRRFGGTGLGLAITQRLVTVMGGAIRVQSAVNEGSCFSFSIALPRAATPPSAIPTSMPEGGRILILADNPFIADVAADYARACSLHAFTCAAPGDILEHLHDAEKRGEGFDYILVDYNLDGVRFFEMVDRIRLFPDFQKIDFIVVATLGSPTATRILNSDKIAALLTRPLFPDQLEDALKILRHARRQPIKTGLVTRSLIGKLRGGNRTGQRTFASFSGASILVVEDIEVNQILMAKILDKLGCKAEAAMSGYEAIDKLRAKSYDLVFMDGHMPGMDGCEAARRIRHMEMETGNQAIIVALTADAMSGGDAKYIDAGMNDYLNKPVTPESIAAMLGKWVARERAL